MSSFAVAVDRTELPRTRAGLSGAARSVRRGARPFVDLEVIIPVLNEEQRLPLTLLRTLEYLEQRPYRSAVVVVDNGSVDRTAAVARAAMGGPVPVHLIGCARPGKGSAVRMGLSTGCSRHVGFMDADLATPIDVLDRVLPLLRAGVSAVIASRQTVSAEMVLRQGLLRRLGGAAFRAVARMVLPSITDSQCGFKFFSGPAVRAAAADCEVDGFSFDVELLVRMRQAGNPIVEVPVAWTDAVGSTFHPLRDGLGCFRDTIRIRRLTYDRYPSAPRPDPSTGPGPLRLIEVA